MSRFASKLTSRVSLHLSSSSKGNILAKQKAPFSQWILPTPMSTLERRVSTSDSLTVYSTHAAAVALPF